MRDKCVELSDNANKMRDKLIELVAAAKNAYYDYSYEKYEKGLPVEKSEVYIADRLLANSVIVPPCKVGDTVYVINEWEVEETAVFSMKIESEDSGWVVFLKARVTDYAIKSKDRYASIFKTFIFGKTVFLTREEAERALKGGEQ